MKVIQIMKAGPGKPNVWIEGGKNPAGRGRSMCICNKIKVYVHSHTS